MQIKVRIDRTGTKRGKWRCDHESPRCGLAMAARLLGLHTGMQTQMGLRLGWRTRRVGDDSAQNSFRGSRRSAALRQREG